MSWTVKFNQDTEAPGLGTVTATLTDDQSGEVISTYERQVKTMSEADCASFVSEAKGSATAAQEKQASSKAASDKVVAGILAGLNK